MRKKVDSRIRTLVENGVKLNHRSLFVVIGDKGHDQVHTLHYMLSKALVKRRPSILWCYKDKLPVSSHQKKRAKQLKKMAERGLLDPDKENTFDRLALEGLTRYCKYEDTQTILGNTYGVCVLQDFASLKPNTLARTIETVEGGGIVVLLLSTLTSLTSLYTMVMNYSTDSHPHVTGRFNERFTLSLASCKACLFIDDELNILQVNSHTQTITAVPVFEGPTEPVKELLELKESLRDAKPAGLVIAKCRTLDQGKAVLTFIDAIAEKTLQSTVALTAARGRGKSAALGLAIAAAVAFGPKNVKTLFKFVCEGFDALESRYQVSCKFTCFTQEHLDYDLVTSTNPDLHKAVVRLNIFRQHRQTVQYVQPQDHEKLAQAELVVIDEAAAIPLPLVKALLGPYLVSVNGYEGTGRSLSLKLFQQLRDGARNRSGRAFREVELSEPIRYAAADPVETWLNELLCLNAANHVPRLLEGRLPTPRDFQLFYVNRDTLFSYHKASEVFLQSMMSLFVASHYKNTPDDLQLMSDAPAHHLFVLLAPVDETQNTMPDILCALQVCLEGKISRDNVTKALKRGIYPSGDQISWKIAELFQDAEFAHLSGARIVRIAVHPNLLKAGYGTVAVNKLIKYYEGHFTEDGDVPTTENKSVPAKELLDQQLKPRSDLPPLLVSLSERPAERIHYVGVSYGLTEPLHKFWTHKLGFSSVYVAQSPEPSTGEHCCMVLRATKVNEVHAKGDGDWIKPFNEDFRRRFISLLGSRFRHFTPALALSVLNPEIDHETEDAMDTQGILGGGGGLLTPYDMKRIGAYVNNMASDRLHLIMDLVPCLARLYFLGRLPVTISPVQALLLMCLGLQQHNFDHVQSQLQLPVYQIKIMFEKVIRKLHQPLHKTTVKHVDETLPRVREVLMHPHAVSLDEAARLVEDERKSRRDAEEAEPEPALKPDSLQRFAIRSPAEFELALCGKVSGSGLLSVKSVKTENEGLPLLPCNKKRSHSKGPGVPPRRLKQRK